MTLSNKISRLKISSFNLCSYDIGEDSVIHYEAHEKYAIVHYKKVDFSVGTGKKSTIEKSPL